MKLNLKDIQGLTRETLREYQHEKFFDRYVKNQKQSIKHCFYCGTTCRKFKGHFWYLLNSVVCPTCIGEFQTYFTGDVTKFTFKGRTSECISYNTKRIRRLLWKLNKKVHLMYLLDMTTPPYKRDPSRKIIPLGDIENFITSYFFFDKKGYFSLEQLKGKTGGVVHYVVITKDNVYQVPFKLSSVFGENNETLLSSYLSG